MQLVLFPMAARGLALWEAGAAAGGLVWVAAATAAGTRLGSRELCCGIWDWEVGSCAVASGEARGKCCSLGSVRKSRNVMDALRGVYC